VTAPIDMFRHCPACAATLSSPGRAGMIECAACGFVYHFNPTVAAGAFLVRPQGEALFVRRARNPARGKLALPGGFIEIGETAEQSLRREIREEVGLEVEHLAYLCSAINAYDYRGITYPVLDLFFVGHLTGTDAPAALEDVQSLHWLDPRTVDPDEIAFPSIRAALDRYRLPTGPA
jgi:ADP-ribose pyrophosphatase YjhB (NUDIX family)